MTPTRANDATWRTQFSGVLVGGCACLTLAAMLIASWPFEFQIYLPLFVAALAASILLLALKRTLQGCVLLAISISAPLLLYLVSGMSTSEFVHFLHATGA